MTSNQRLQQLKKKAYIPEHLPEYLVPYSEADPAIDNDLVYYSLPGQLNIIAYPLEEEGSGKDLGAHVTELASRIKPRTLKIISPVELTIDGYKTTIFEKDFYSCLELKKIRDNAKLRNMLKRAAQDVRVETAESFSREHLELLSEFIRKKGFAKEKSVFFHRLPDYLAEQSQALMVEARHKKNNALAGFDVFEPGYGDYSFYLFNITSLDSDRVPGINDLLMNHALNLLKSMNKKYLNTGLCINPGIESFKAKWGAVRFLPYHFQTCKPSFDWKKIFRRSRT
ncbi:hypothetical protein [Desulfonatronovibrio hydrogenovorans]|uniref:hypothetical protein n=1 Tax=Desulfonatronovibrio hydrogenovorans TaxID=53245 RepID=UPI00048EAECB|nr:hypothetical protein [Desulfonatronovibrio hydrogenovorans]